MSDEPIKMTHEEWVAKGKALYGDDLLKWKFVCPGCGHVQAVEDFEQYKVFGATPESARQECIGRYSGGGSWIEGKGDKSKGCDYAGYGLLKISPVRVVVDGIERSSFAFADG